VWTGTQPIAIETGAQASERHRGRLLYMGCVAAAKRIPNRAEKRRGASLAGTHLIFGKSGHRRPYSDARFRAVRQSKIGTARVYRPNAWPSDHTVGTSGLTLRRKTWEL